MPCYDERNSASWQGKHVWKPRLDLLTRVACNLADTLERGGSLENCSNETRRWVEEHNREDRRRQVKKAKEQSLLTKKRIAMSKLTDEDRRILGIRP